MVNWMPDTSVRPGIFAAWLHDADTGDRLARVSQASNTFAGPGEYDLDIYSDGVRLQAAMTPWSQLRAFLVRIFPGHGLDDLELPPHQIERRKPVWR